jgi:hypothetical protein
MTELLLILAVIFVAYVFYGSQKKPENTVHSSIIPAKPDRPVSVTAIKPLTAQVISKAEKAPANHRVSDTLKTAKSVTTGKSKPATSKTANPTAATQNTKKPGLKDPKTGDITTPYSNYRFTKRWIKEALVAEGLLDKVYKNDELNLDIETKIKSVIVKFESIKKYRV